MSWAYGRHEGEILESKPVLGAVLAGVSMNWLVGGSCLEEVLVVMV